MTTKFIFKFKLKDDVQKKYVLHLMLALLGLVTLFPSAEARSKKNKEIISREAKTIDRSADEFIKKLRQIAKKSEGDSVGDFDQADEIAIYMQNKLAEAYASILFEISNQDSPHKLIKSLGKKFTKEKVAALKVVWQEMQRFPDTEDGKIKLQQYILEQSEAWAVKEIKTAQKSFEKEFRTVISEKEKSRNRSRDLPGV